MTISCYMDFRNIDWQIMIYLLRHDEKKSNYHVQWSITVCESECDGFSCIRVTASVTVEYAAYHMLQVGGMPWEESELTKLLRICYASGLD